MSGVEQPKILDSINEPSDLRRLNEKELTQLSGELRDFIVRATALTGGHLGSNLGAVELTLALHRVFESPRDILLWDTGHQTYVHKIITGRKDRFDLLRQEDGLSGYPSRAESPHDWVENSHASTILSYAHGLATAVDKNRRIVAVIGDGSMTGGMAFEALNNLGQSGDRVTIVLNDNGRSYAPTISWLGDNLSRLRGNPTYMVARNAIEKGIKSVPAVGGFAAAGVKSMKAAVREFIEPFAFFETLGVRYVGPFDGHDILGMEAALRDAAIFDGPIVVHVLTEKGRGYAPAEDDDEKKLHDVKVFDYEVGPVLGQKAGDYTEAFSEALIAAGEKYPQVHAITAAMPGPTGLIPFQERFPDRFHDVGIAEQHATTAAAGMAMGGLRPIVAVYSTFFTRAMDQAVYDVGLHKLPVIFALDRAGITGENGASHHGVLDIALTTSIPGMTVFAPSSAQEMQAMMTAALDLDGPAAIRFPAGKARQVNFDHVGSGLDARLVRDGTDICIIAVGKLLEEAEIAAERLAAEGISVAVWDPRVIKPLDQKMIQHACTFANVITVEDGIRIGGAGSAISDAITQCESTQNPTVYIMGTPDRYIPQAKAAAILSELGLDADGIADAIRVAMRNTSATKINL